MIFAAGLGTRLKPFTDSHPKALAEVCGRPMLGLVIEKLKRAGITDFVVNIHHFGSQICDYLRQNDNFGVEIEISDESGCLLDTGGGILAARQLLDCGDDFVIHNADILTDFDMNKMIEFHHCSNNDVTLLVASRKTKRYIAVDKISGKMCGWINIESGETRPSGFEVTEEHRLLAFGGVHVVSPRIFAMLDDFSADYKCADGCSSKFSIMDFYIQACRTLKIGAYCPSESYMWHDIGKPESLSAAENDMASFLARK